MKKWFWRDEQGPSHPCQYLILSCMHKHNARSKFLLLHYKCFKLNTFLFQISKATHWSAILPKTLLKTIRFNCVGVQTSNKLLQATLFNICSLTNIAWQVSDTQQNHFSFSLCVEYNSRSASFSQKEMPYAYLHQNISTTYNNFLRKKNADTWGITQINKNFCSGHILFMLYFNSTYACKTSAACYTVNRL